MTNVAGMTNGNRISKMKHLCATNLSYERNEKLILDTISFSICSGEMLQIQGVNGAGKTTLMRILAGLIPLANGQITWNGEPLVNCHAAYDADLIYIGHYSGIKLGLTVKENLQMMAALAMTEVKEEALDRALFALNLSAYKEVYAQQLSAGQQRRVALAKLLLLKKTLWLLDEPLAALDQEGITIMHELMGNHLRQNGMLVVTSHQPLRMQEGLIKHCLRLRAVDHSLGCDDDE